MVFIVDLFCYIDCRLLIYLCCWRTQRFSLLKKVLSVFKTVDFEVSQRFNFTALTRFCFLAIYMYILALYSTCCQLWFLRSNRQNSHRLLLESFRPLNHSAHCKMKAGWDILGWWIFCFLFLLLLVSSIIHGFDEVQWLDWIIYQWIHWLNMHYIHLELTLILTPCLVPRILVWTISPSRSSVLPSHRSSWN